MLWLSREHSPLCFLSTVALVHIPALRFLPDKYSLNTPPYDGSLRLPGLILKNLAKQGAGQMTNSLSRYRWNTFPSLPLLGKAWVEMLHMGVTLTHTAQCGPSPLQSSHTAGPMVFNFKKDHIFLLTFYPGLFNDSPASSFPACLQVCAAITIQMLFSNKGKPWAFPSEGRSCSMYSSL